MLRVQEIAADASINNHDVESRLIKLRLVISLYISKVLQFYLVVDIVRSNRSFHRLFLNDELCISLSFIKDCSVKHWFIILPESDFCRTTVNRETELIHIILVEVKKNLGVSKRVLLIDERSWLLSQTHRHLLEAQIGELKSKLEF